MNKAKRNLILASAIINIIVSAASLALSILITLNAEILMQYAELQYILSIYSTNIVMTAISFAIGLVGSIFLLYSVRQKGKYFRSSQGLYVAGLIIVIVCGGYISWILLLISCFIPDVVIINTPREVRREEKMEDQAYEEKKKKIEELKRLRDNGIISEEEYKQKLFELL